MKCLRISQTRHVQLMKGLFTTTISHQDQSRVCQDSLLSLLRRFHGALQRVASDIEAIGKLFEPFKRINWQINLTILPIFRVGIIFFTN